MQLMKSRINYCVAMLLLLVGVACSQSGNGEKIRITIVAADSLKEAQLSYSDINNVEISKGEFRSGTAVLDTILPRTTFYTLTLDNRYCCTLYLQPGDDLKVMVTDGTISFEGSRAKENVFLLELQDYSSKVDAEYSVDLKDAENYIRAIQSKSDKIDAYVDEKYGVSDEFSAALKFQRRFQNNLSIMMLRGMLKSIFGIEQVIPRETFEFLSADRFDDPVLNQVSFINKYLQEFFKTMEYQGFIEGQLEDFPMNRLAYIGDPEIKEGYINALLDEELYRCNPDFLAIVDRLSGSVSDKEKLNLKRNLFEPKAKELLPLKEGAEAFDFQATDANGKTHKLSDYRGKVVAIDVWSTNCIPCIAEMPYLKEVEKEFTEEEVIFLAYSIDTDVKRWKSFLQRDSLEGIQLIDTLARKSEMVQNYQIRSTPRMIIIDKEGRIVTAYGPKPSDPRLKLLIRKTVNNNEKK